MMKPPWLKRPIPSGRQYHRLKSLLQDQRLHTVCEEAQCPNIGECWNQGSATIMIMGDICTRSCGFCAVHTGKPLQLDHDEPLRVAMALAELKLKHVVITSVDRDDLPDGGAQHFAETILRVQEHCPETIVEVLIPDFKGKTTDLNTVFQTNPNILNHNLETVASLQKEVRPQASYQCSLQVLSLAHEAGMVTKSGLMLGLGENRDEVQETLYDLKEKGKVSILTLGQYLRPTPQHLPIKRYLTPDEFEELKDFALSLGFQSVASGPFVRSSYFAEQTAQAIKKL